MIKRLTYQQAGFTIVELVLYMGLFSVLIVVLSGIFLDLVNLQLVSRSSSSVTQNLNYLFARIPYDIYQASSLTTPANAGDSGSVLSLVTGGQSYSYTYSYPNLVLTTPSGSFTLNTSDVSVTEFTVTRLGTVERPNIQIQLTVQSNIVVSGRDPETVTYTSAYTLK